MYVIVSFARYNPEPGFFKCQIWIPRRKTLRVGPVTKHSGTVKEKSQLSLYYHAYYPYYNYMLNYYQDKIKKISKFADVFHTLLQSWGGVPPLLGTPRGTHRIRADFPFPFSFFFAG